MERNQEIECELEVVDLQHSHCYIALSYTWGSPINDAAEIGTTSSTTHAIKCNGNTVPVTRNLYGFLQRVHCEPEISSRQLWIDFLCISQQDVAERGSQVSLMASIYGSSDMVIAWLGEEGIYTKESFMLTGTLGALCEECLAKIMPNNIKTE